MLGIDVMENELYHSSFFQQRKIMKLPPSAKFVLYLLKTKGPMNRKRIIQDTLMPDRTVGFALKLLQEEGLIEKADLRNNPLISQGKRKKHKQDRRITNYTLVSPISNYQMIET